MSLRPWREIAVPHPDVLAGTFLQSEFAADISAVRRGEASPEYQNATAFFQRTYITEGMRLLLSQVAQRLNGRGGEPVVQLQTAFGGGKTHTMLAVYHLATRDGSLNALAGVPGLLDHAGVMDVPRARVAILDGTAHAPAQPWRHGDYTVHTLWGELAWQLGGAEAYEQVKAADTSGTSPGKDALRTLIDAYAPCVVLVDELVAYVRQFADGKQYAGGTYDSNLSFVQALTEAVKLVPNAMLLASLPESEVEAGSSVGVAALRALEKTLGRVQALWKPVATEESFEIVRRRLFEPIRDEAARDAVCQAFGSLYTAEGARMPSETQEARYQDRLVKAYPIHPEVFDRLYEDWAALEKFQRTRGVLKLMALAIHELWQKGNTDLLIMPGSLPLYRGKTRDELLSHLAPGWDSVLDRDVDDDRAESADLDTREARFGAIQAARRVARTTFLGSAPSSVAIRNAARGVDRGRILLGCVQPGQTSSTYADALSRLADRLHYLNHSDGKSAETARFWFDTHANLRREMEDRKGRVDDRNELRGKVAAILAKQTATRGMFDAVHVFTPHADVPDDGQLRLVVLDTERAWTRQSPQTATDAVLEFVRNNGARPRFRANRLLFLAADGGAVARLRDTVRTSLAWASIVADIAAGRLNVDRLKEAQAKKEAESAEAVAVRAVRETFRFVLSPVLHAATARDVDVLVEAFQLNTGAASLAGELEHVCTENELVVSTWAPTHLRTRLRELYWKPAQPAVRAFSVWDDMQKYLYMPRLRDRAVFDSVVRAGAPTKDFYGIAQGQSDAGLEGLQLGCTVVQVDESLWLVEPAAAQRLLDEAAQRERDRIQPPDLDRESRTGGGATTTTNLDDRSNTDRRYPESGDGGLVTPPPPPRPKAATRFFATAEVRPASAKMTLTQLSDELISLISRHPTAEVKVRVEIEATFPDGAPDDLKRAVTENAQVLGVKLAEWE